jgi:hypothetical protein
VRCKAKGDSVLPIPFLDTNAQDTFVAIKPRLHLASTAFFHKLPSKSKNPEGKV